MQGTPTLLLFDRQGRLRRHYLGAVDDVRLGAEIMALSSRTKGAARGLGRHRERLPRRSSIPSSTSTRHDGELLRRPPRARSRACARP